MTSTLRAVRLASILLLVLAASAAPLQAAPSIEDFLRRDAFDEMRLSPSGEYIAASMPLGDHGGLVVIRRATMERTAALQLPKNMHVADIHWVNDERLVYALAEKSGALEQPRFTGELVGLDADGGRRGVLAGPRGHEDSFSHIRKDNQLVFAEWVGRLPGNDKEVLVSIYDNATFNQVERMNVVDGKRRKVAASPIRHASFVVDTQGEVRFAFGQENDLGTKLFYRVGRGESWSLLNDEAQSGEIVSAIGFHRDGRTAFLQVSRRDGPDAIYRYDVESGDRTQVLVDDVVDPSFYLESSEDGSVYGAVFDGPHPRVEYLDSEHPDARSHAAMAASFPGQLTLPVSSSRNAAQTLYFVQSDRNPGDFFLLDRATKKADYVGSRARDIDPEDLAEVQPVEFNARDGLLLRGFLTVPKVGGKPFPMILNPHGGPYGIHDSWLYDGERQMLAAQGYAVLQVNFRGSGNYGVGFEQAGLKQWGRQMQDDLTDATRWAIEQGVADASRICIYGASYGAYAALMGVAREPGLYRCAAGNVGVYDLELMYKDGDIEDTILGRNYLKTAIGQEGLEEISPVYLTENIRVPVMLAAGKEDERAPAKHTERMRDALKRAGVEVDMTLYRGEGHGYFRDENRADFYKRLFGFFERNLAKEEAHSVETGR